MRLRRRTRRINLDCLVKGHLFVDWWGGHPNLECFRPGCTLRGDDLIDPWASGPPAVASEHEADR